jgi:hypothetical protein
VYGNFFEKPSLAAELRSDDRIFLNHDFIYDEILSYKENKEIHEWNVFFHHK